MTSSDRQLLERAAKAAGIDLTWENERPQYIELFRGHLPNYYDWNPLTDDGDALRLAVRMAQLYGFFRFMRRWMICMADEGGDPSDPYAATRRAIVRAAASLGEHK